MHATILEPSARSIRAFFLSVLLCVLGVPLSAASQGTPVSLFGAVEMTDKRAEASDEVLRAFRVTLTPDLLAGQLSTTERLEIALPDGYWAQARRVAVQQRGDGYTWHGRLTRGGDMVLSVQGGYLAGVWFDGTEVYQILPQELATEAGVADEVEYRLLHIDAQRYPECAVAEAPAVLRRAYNESVEIADDIEAPAHPSADKAANEVDVMVVYTPAARSAAGGVAAMNVLIQNAIDITNTAYGNSGIDAELRLAHFREIAYTETDISASLDWLESDGDVAALRERYGADLVALLSADGLYCGLGNVQRTANASWFEDYAFQVTVWNCAVGNLSFAHEFGHTQGCEHNPENGISPSSLASYPYSYGHYYSGNYRTVMSYSNPCAIYCPRVPYFSNSTVSYSGEVTGILDARENYRTINDTAATMAGYKAPPTWFFEDSFESGDLSQWTVSP